MNAGASSESIFQGEQQDGQEAFHFLNSLDIFTMKLGLERIRALLDTLGNPQNGLPMIHVAGTNGKGSVTTMLSTILQTAGHRTGHFISPHLVDVRERIALNGEPIPSDDFQDDLLALKRHLESLNWPREEWPTYFECLNVLAYRYFQRTEAAMTVFETGLGGRLDSTNVVQRPHLTVITSIGLEHTRYLGNTLAAIAGEKAGIIKPGVPLVLGPSLPEETRSVILQRAMTLESPVFEAGADRLTLHTEKSTPESGLWLEDERMGHSYRLPLAAPYQRDNLATVLVCVELLRSQGMDISDQALMDGLMNTRWPARFQYFEKERLLLDGSHNADGFRSLETGLKLYFQNRPLLWLLSLRNDRPPHALLEFIARFPLPLGIIATVCTPEKEYHPPARLIDLARQRLGNDYPTWAIDNPTEALSRLQEQLAVHTAQNPLGIITGSLYTAGHLLKQLEN